MIDKQQLDAELTALLPFLPGWQLDPAYNSHTWCAVLIDDNGHGIHVSASRAKGRFYLSGMWPWTADRQQYRPDTCQHISVARDRPPEKIAADIKRRFLPWYIAAYAEQTERVQRHETSRQRQQALTIELATLLGQDSVRRTQSNPNQIYAGQLTVDVHSDESVSIQLRYTGVKVAKAVLRAFTKAGGTSE